MAEEKFIVQPILYTIKIGNWQIKVWQISSIHQIRQTKVQPNFQSSFTVYYTVTNARTSAIYLSGQSGMEFDVVVESNILGFVYKDVWTPVTGEVLTSELEDEYSFEPSLL